MDPLDPANVCVHLTGVGPTTCHAGVDYDSVKTGTHRPEWPCTNLAVPCASRLLPAAQLAANQKWFDELAGQGVQIVHPDDGWVDREANTIRFVYPTMQHALPAPGVLVALGTRERWRVVMLKREVLQPVGMSSLWAFVEERPKVAEPDADDDARAFAAAHISLDASRRIVDLLASRPVDAALIAEAAQIAHEADVKVRALLPTPASPDLGTLDNGEPVRTPPQKVWRVVGGVGAWWWFWPDTDSFGAMVGKHEHPGYAYATRWSRARRHDGPSIRLRGAIREAGHTSVHVDTSEVEAAWPTMSDAQREGWQSVSVTVTEGGNAASLTAPTGGLVGVATTEPNDVGVLHDLHRRLLAEDIDALVVVDEDPGANAVARVLDAYFAEGALRCLRTRAGYPNGSTVRVVTARDLDAHPDMIAGSILDVAVVLAPISTAALDEVRARLLRNCGTLIGFGAPVLSIRTPTESFADAGPTLSVPIRREDVTVTASPTYPDPTGWIRALRGPAPGADTTSASGDFTIEDFEDAIRALESNAITPPAVVAGPNVARLADALGAIATSWDVSGLDEPATPAMARQLVPTDGGGLREACAPVGSDAADDLDEVRRLLAAGDRGNAWLAGGDAIRNGARWSDDLSPPLDEPLDRAQVAALAGERPSLAVQTEPREAGWLRDLVEPAPPSEAERIAAHVAAVAPGYRERARAWLDAEHADMVEDLAALMATVSAECCS